jgi:hypothetical protein
LDKVEISTSCAVCVSFKGGLRVYFGLDLSLSKLSIAQSSRKFCEQHTGGWPERVETRLTDDGGKEASPACGDQGRIHSVYEGQQCSDREAQQGAAARHSEARVS